LREKYQEWVKSHPLLTEVLGWLLTVLVAVVIGILLNKWMMTLPIMQPHYMKPEEMKFDLTKLIYNCVGLVVMVICGFIFGWKIEDSQES